MTGEFAAVFVALFVGHQVGDHWTQTSHQAQNKGKPGWFGRWNCIKHVTTYTLTGLVALSAMALSTGWHPNPVTLVIGMAVSAISHYVADRRTPLAKLAEWTGSGDFWRMGSPRPFYRDNVCLGTGAYALDQSFHYAWLFVAALIIAH